MKDERRFCPYLRIAEPNQIPDAVCVDKGKSIKVDSPLQRLSQCRFKDRTDENCCVLPGTTIIISRWNKNANRGRIIVEEEKWFPAKN